MKYEERPLAVAAGDEQMAAILAVPEGAVRCGVVIVVGGPQYRAGSHRQFTLLARQLAAEGIATLRADLVGMGDSTGVPRSFENRGTDVARLAEALHAAIPGLERLALLGLCDGASACLLCLDEFGSTVRVDRLVLINPWVKSAALEARARLRHYYLQRVLSSEFWRKLLSGAVGSQAARGWMQAWRASRGSQPCAGQAPERRVDFTERMTRAAQAFRGPSLYLLSGRDQTADEFRELIRGSRRWQSLLRRPDVRRIDFEAADHTFSEKEQWVRAARSCAEWLITA